MRYLRLLRLFARTELQFELEYRANLLAELAVMVLIVSTSFGAVVVLYHYTDAINGWTLAQMLVLLGVFYVVQGAEEMFLQPSVTKLMEHVRMGTLDYVLLKPANSQFMVSLRHMALEQLAQVGLGVVLVGYGVLHLGTAVTPWQVLAFVLTLACGMVLIYALLLSLATLAFWATKVENVLVIFWSFLDAGRFPVDIYPGWLRLTMSTLVPIGIAVTVPAQALAGRLDGPGLLSTLAATAGAWLFSGWFWRRGLRSYTGASA